jgi:DNA-binding transcriptional MocR family regulator
MPPDERDLSDDDARQGLGPYLTVVERLPEIFTDADESHVRDVEERFEDAFFTYAGQPSAVRTQPPLYNCACSLSIEVVAHFLRLKGLSASLIHPTVDNLADILEGAGVELRSLDQDRLTSGFDAAGIPTDAVVLVCPNNPTGQSLTGRQFERIARACAQHGKLLIVDFGFRFYSSLVEWDQYEVLVDAGGDFIALEDTGRTWPTLDLEVGLTLASDRIYDDLLEVHEDLVLDVSPFTLGLLRECIGIDAALDGLGSPQRTVEQNRAVLRALLADTPLTIPNERSTISVEWVRLPPGWRAPDVCDWLTANDVHVLPGMPFYWDRPALGEPFIRVALARSPDEFARSASELARLVGEFATRHASHHRPRSRRERSGPSRRRSAGAARGRRR